MIERLTPHNMPQVSYILHNNKVIKYIPMVVHEFSIHSAFDVSQRMSMFDNKLWKYLNTDEGKWVTNHTTESLKYSEVMSVMTYMTECQIVAVLTEKDATFFKLKYK